MTSDDDDEVERVEGEEKEMRKWKNTKTKIKNGLLSVCFHTVASLSLASIHENVDVFFAIHNKLALSLCTVNALVTPHTFGSSENKNCFNHVTPTRQRGSFTRERRKQQHTPRMSQVVKCDSYENVVTDGVGGREASERGETSKGGEGEAKRKHTTYCVEFRDYHIIQKM